MVRSSLMILAAALACTAPVTGQDNPLSSVGKSDYRMVRDFVIRAAEKMPEESYGFKPRPEVRSFALLIGHIADDQYAYCLAVKGENRSSDFEKTAPPKPEMVVALKLAFAHCDASYDVLVDVSAIDNVKFRGREVPRVIVLLLHSGHAWEHYGNVVVYLRLNGLVPPSNEKAAM
jgi:uncharacterized damage-inducible protein DinB